MASLHALVPRPAWDMQRISRYGTAGLPGLLPAKGVINAKQARRRRTASASGRPGSPAIETSGLSRVHLARWHAPRHPDRLPLEWSGDRAGHGTGRPEDEGTHGWGQGGADD